MKKAIACLLVSVVLVGTLSAFASAYCARMRMSASRYRGSGAYGAIGYGRGGYGGSGYGGSGYGGSGYNSAEYFRAREAQFRYGQSLLEEQIRQRKEKLDNRIARAERHRRQRTDRMTSFRRQNLERSFGRAVVSYDSEERTKISAEWYLKGRKSESINEKVSLDYYEVSYRISPHSSSGEQSRHALIRMLGQEYVDGLYVRSPGDYGAAGSGDDDDDEDDEADGRDRWLGRALDESSESGDDDEEEQDDAH